MLSGRVDVYAEDTSACGEKLFMPKCQADQLAVAIRSPITAKKQENGCGIEVIEESPWLSRLIDNGEVGDGHRGPWRPGLNLARRKLCSGGTVPDRIPGIIGTIFGR